MTAQILTHETEIEPFNLSLNAAILIPEISAHARVLRPTPASGIRLALRRGIQIGILVGLMLAGQKLYQTDMWRAPADPAPIVWPEVNDSMEADLLALPFADNRGSEIVAELEARDGVHAVAFGAKVGKLDTGGNIASLRHEAMGRLGLTPVAPLDRTTLDAATVFAGQAHDARASTTTTPALLVYQPFRDVVVVVTARSRMSADTLMRSVIDRYPPPRPDDGRSGVF